MIRTILTKRLARALLPVTLVATAFAVPATIQSTAAATTCAPLPKTVGYTANFRDDTISKIDLKGRRVLKTLPGFPSPWAVELNRSGSLLYVTTVLSQYDPNGAQVVVVDTCTNKIVKKFPTVGPGYEQVSPNHKWLYVPNLLGTGIQVIDMDTATLNRTILTTLPLPQGGVSWDQKTMYAVSLPNLAYPIDMGTGLPGVPIDLGLFPLQFGMSPNGRIVEVSDVSDHVVLIDTQTNKVVGSVQTGSMSQPAISAYTPDSKEILIGGYSGSIRVIDVATHSVVKAWELHAASFGTSISADGKEAYVTTTDTGSVANGTGLPFTAASLFKLVPPAGGLIRIYDTATWKEIGTIKTGNGPIGVALRNFSTGINAPGE